MKSHAKVGQASCLSAGDDLEGDRRDACPTIVLLNPTCLDVLPTHRAWLDTLGVNLVADDSFRALRPEQVDDVLAGAEALILPASLRTLPSAELMARHRSLRVLAIAASGFDWLDVDAATRNGIVVTYAPVPAGSEVVADLAFGLMLAVARQIPHYDQLVRRGDHQRGMGVTVWRKTLGIVGLGNIGRAVARRARGFEMRILASDPAPDTTFVQAHGVEIVSLEKLLRESDFISLHVRLNTETHAMIGAKEIALCQPSAFLINTARQELVDEAALTKALLHGRLAGAGLDDPPRAPHSPLLQLPNVVLTPHLGNRALEGVNAVFRCAMENVVAALRGERPQYVLNPEVYDQASLRVSKVGQASCLSSASEVDRQDAHPTLLPFDPAEPINISARHLPHWQQPGWTYFVTFRLADSLPQDKLGAWKAERDQWLKLHPEPRSTTDTTEYHRRFTVRLHELLDAGMGACWLRQSPLADLVERALRFFDGQRYGLGDFVIMPNHVHVLVTPSGKVTLSEILHSWKSFTAKELNKSLNRSGPVWQDESFDHIVRSAAQLEKFRHYISDNPIKARLKPDAYRLGKK
jgi:D-3-phosphoglycerate dehydrogenase